MEESSGETTPVALTPQKADGYLTARNLNFIRQWKPMYEEACGIVGFYTPLPWQALAAIEYRENDLTGQVDAPGGRFQLDPGGTGRDLQQRSREYVKQVCYRYKQPWKIADVERDIETDGPLAALCAAHELSSKATRPIAIKGAKGLIVDDVALADAFWGYNGRSQYHTLTGEPDQEIKSWMFSPYVNNDPKRGVILRLRGTIPDDTQPGGRKHIDRPDPRAGCLAIFREVVELFPA